MMEWRLQEAAILLGAERNAVVVKQYFISTSLAVPNPSAKQKTKAVENESHFHSLFL